MKNLLIGLVTLLVLGTGYSQSAATIDAAGCQLHYQTFGSGTPLLIINGGPGMSSEGFVPLAQQLGEKYQTIVFDQRGTGRSTLAEVNKQTVTMDAMVADMETLRQHLGLEDWVVMGHSFGGMLAAYYASQHPDRVKGMILSSSGGIDLSLLSNLNITARLTPDQRDSLQYWNARIADGDTSYHARLKRGQFLAPAYLYDQSHAPAIAERLTQGNSQINSLVWQNMQAMPFDCKAAMAEFTAPVLILHGAEDILDRSIAEGMHTVFPNSSFHVLPECAHYGWLEKPDLYFGKIDAFLKSNFMP